MVPEPAVVRDRLLGAGAKPGFAGLMIDRRYDHEGRLFARDEVLRLRSFRLPDGAVDARLGWKGPTTVTAEGYKSRRELEYEIRGGQGPEALLEALGYAETLRIDRYVEYYHLDHTAVRLEWYPRMDVLIEIEGDGPGIERALAVTGLPRESFTAESLTDFARRYAERTGRPAVLSLDSDRAEPPSWESR